METNELMTTENDEVTDVAVENSEGRSSVVSNVVAVGLTALAAAALVKGYDWVKGKLRDRKTRKNVEKARAAAENEIIDVDPEELEEAE